MIDVCDKVETEDGTEGMVTEIYKNFFCVPFKYIGNPGEWLKQQEPKYNQTELKYHRFYLIEGWDGDRVVVGEKRITSSKKIDMKELF